MESITISENSFVMTISGTDYYYGDVQVSRGDYIRLSDPINNRIFIYDGNYDFMGFDESVDYNAFVDSTSTVNSPEYVSAIVDKDMRILYGVRADSTVFAPDLSDYTLSAQTASGEIITAPASLVVASLANWKVLSGGLYRVNSDNSIIRLGIETSLVDTLPYTIGYVVGNTNKTIQLKRSDHVFGDISSTHDTMDMATIAEGEAFIGYYKDGSQRPHALLGIGGYKAENKLYIMDSGETESLIEEKVSEVVASASSSANTLSKIEDIINSTPFIQDKKEQSGDTSIIDGYYDNEGVALTHSGHNSAVNINPGGVEIISNWEGSENHSDDTGTNNVYIKTGQGKAYYNSNEIATVDQIQPTPNIYVHNIEIRGDNTTRIFATIITSFLTQFDTASFIAYTNNLNSTGGFMCCGTVRTNSSGIATGRTAVRLVPGNSSTTIGVVYHDTGDAGVAGPIYYSEGTGANNISNILDTVIPVFP